MSRTDGQSQVAAAPGRRLTVLERASVVGEIVVTYACVRWQVRRRDLPTAVAALRTTRPRGRRPPPLARDDRRLAAAAERVLARLPGDSRCLTRSLVVLTMLARRGIEVRLILAARPTPTFAAHAWVERAGHPLLPTRGFDDARLTEL
jgi:transglutaminase superfamily protein